MGIDACIHVLFEHEPSREDLLRWGVQIAEALPDSVAGRYTHFEHVFQVEELLFGAYAKLIGRAYKVWTFERYYGRDGYERGRWPVIRDVIEWCWRNLPMGTQVFYHGDNQLKSFEEPFSRVEMEEYDSHYYSEDGQNYRRRYEQVGPHPDPSCGRCEGTSTINDVGFSTRGGARWRSLSCMACQKCWSRDARTGGTEERTRYDLYRSPEWLENVRDEALRADPLLAELLGPAMDYMIEANGGQEP